MASTSLEDSSKAAGPTWTYLVFDITEVERHTRQTSCAPVGPQYCTFVHSTDVDVIIYCYPQWTKVADKTAPSHVRYKPSRRSRSNCGTRTDGKNNKSGGQGERGSERVIESELGNEWHCRGLIAKILR